MKIFAIRDKNDSSNKDLAYLIYYQKAKKFYIELPEHCNPWKLPLLISSFADKGQYSIDSYWSKVWVQQRIIPTDRQNLGEILKSNNLKEYDEYSLLMLSNGRCEQDDYYLTAIKEIELPNEIKTRNGKRIEYVAPLDKYNLIVFFKNGIVKLCNVKMFFNDLANKNIKYKDYNLFSKVKIKVGGYGLTWGTNLNISNDYLYDSGKNIPLTINDFKNFVLQATVNSSEASDLLNCSRQNIEDLVKRNKLHPIKESDKNKLYLKDDVLRKAWD